MLNFHIYFFFRKERSVDIDSLGELLDEVGKPLPGFKIRQMLPTLTLKTSGRVNVLEFGSIYHDQERISKHGYPTWLRLSPSSLAEMFKARSMLIPSGLRRLSKTKMSNGAVRVEWHGRIVIPYSCRIRGNKRVRIPRSSVRRLSGFCPTSRFQLEERFHYCIFRNPRIQVKKDIASSFRKTIDAAEGVVSKTGASSWSTHTYSLEEREAFADWINTRLKDDPDCKNLLPITVDDESLFEKVSDGILLCKLINLSQPETIDERAINKTKLRNGWKNKIK